MKSALIEKLQQVMDEHVANHSECGCQLVIYRDGEMVCDLAAGYLDGDRTAKVDHDTLFPVFSAGKSILTTLVHICVEKGFFKYEDPVSKYWREYACNGKQDTCIRHLLTHRGALWDFPADFEFRDRYNWEKSCAALEQSPLLGELDGFHEYHAYTYGVLLGRVLEKAVRKPLRSILKEFILDPLEITDFFWGNPGMRNANTARIVPIVSEDGTPMLNEWLEINKAEYLFDGLNPSVNTAATASALAKIHASLVGRGYRNIRLLSDATIENAVQIRRHPDYPVRSDEWDKFGLGYIVSGECEPWNRFFGQAGACGSEGFADRETLYAVGLTRNQQLASDPDYPLRNAVSDILGIPRRVW